MRLLLVAAPLSQLFAIPAWSATAGPAGAAGLDDRVRGTPSCMTSVSL